MNGNTEVLGMLESVLDAGRYDMVFVESGDRAYSQIKKVLPNLVILCTRIEQLDGFQLLTMLKLDPETRDIPVLTYTTEYEGQDFDDSALAAGRRRRRHVRQPSGAADELSRALSRRSTDCRPRLSRACYSSAAMPADKRDAERVPMLGELQGEIMVFQPMLIKEISLGGALVETRFPLHLNSLHDLRLDAGHALDRRQGARRPLADQRRRSGRRGLLDRNRVRRAVGARGCGDRRIPGVAAITPQRRLVISERVGFHEPRTRAELLQVLEVVA